MTSQAYKADATVGPGGKVEVNLPLPPGTPVEVFVYVPQGDSFADLVDASRSATGFWDNPMDDEDWNAPNTR
jgi:hypothetical protein